MLFRKGLIMSDQFKITLAQLNATVGDLSGNNQKVMEAWEIARDERSDLIAFPEMFITGYNPQDLILKNAFQKAATSSIEQIAAACSQGPAIAIGGPFCDGDKLYNSYYILADGKIQAVIKKHHLPNEEVFDRCVCFHQETLMDHFRLGKCE